MKSVTLSGWHKNDSLMGFYRRVSRGEKINAVSCFGLFSNFGVLCRDSDGA
jgi:hypothetical protein